MQPIAEDTAARIVLWTVVAAYLSMIAALAVSDISLDLLSTPHVLGIVGGVVPFALYARWRRMAVLPTAFECIGAVLMLAIPVLVWTYAAMRLNMPLTDAELIAMDEALAFDWHAFVAFVDTRPWLAAMLAMSYVSFPYQLLVLPFLLALTGFSARGYALVFAYALVCFISSVVGIWYPALGAYPTYGVAHADLASIDIKFGYFFLEQFHAVRDQAEFALRVDTAAGIVTFPSVHAAAAALCAWAAWGSRLLRLPFLALNVLMAVSAISHGSHYLIDVVAGIGIAGLCVSVTMLVFYRQLEDRSPVLASFRQLDAVLRRAPSSRAAMSD